MKIYSPNGRLKKSFYVDPLDLVHAGGQEGLQRFYNPCFITSGATTTVTPTSNLLYSTAFIAPRRLCKIKNIAVYVSTAQAAQNCVFGVYANYRLGMLYPGQLVFQSQQISTASTGRKDSFVDVELSPGGIYWLTFLTSSTTAVFRTIFGPPNGSIDIGDNGFFAYTAVRNTFNASFAYSATLPANYPSNSQNTANIVAPVFFEFTS